MAITVQDAILKFRRAATILEKTRKDDLMIIAKDTMALVKSRVINRGESASGSKFKPYSKAVVPVTLYKNKEARGAKSYDNLYKAVTGSARGSKRKGQPTKGLGGWFASYKDWREINRLQTDHKDFSFTSRMWKSVQPILIKSDQLETVIEIKSNTPKENNKLRWNSEQEGISLLAANTDEEKKVRKAYETRINRRIKEAGL
jgi:hypothetical protein